MDLGKKNHTAYQDGFDGFHINIHMWILILCLYITYMFFLLHNKLISIENYKRKWKKIATGNFTIKITYDSLTVRLKVSSLYRTSLRMKVF